uniref:Putative lipocalin n=1 Tax=Ixodes ricinus TaxID=34613 RepID=A0A6B0V1N3_IXORI
MKVFLLIFCVSPAISTDCSALDGFDASKFFKSFKEGYIKFTSQDIGLTCTAFSQIEMQNDFKVARYNVTFRRVGSRQAETRNQTVEVQSKPDQVLVFEGNNTDAAYNMTLIYSVPGKCGIFRGNENSSYCSVYVKIDASDTDIDNCVDFLPRLCGNHLYNGSDFDEWLGFKSAENPGFHSSAEGTSPSTACVILMSMLVPFVQKCLR